MKAELLTIAMGLMLLGCSNEQAAIAPEAIVAESVSSENNKADNTPMGLPVPHANNAVALVENEAGATVWSFNGLRAGKTYQDASKNVFSCALPEGLCRQAGDVPVDRGRLASVAVTLGGMIYLFGGYTVAEDGTEVSTPEVFAFNPETEEYISKADMPVPVDDAVGFAFGERYIALVSGWHNDGNLGVMQLFDTQEGFWLAPIDYPGMPVFGHAGGAVGNKFIIADGVGVIGMKDGRRQFGAINEVWLGEFDLDDFTNVHWRKLPPHPGGALYRMAATGDPDNNRIVFYGGGDNPYNYNGIGYDGIPAKPSDILFAFDLEKEQWIELSRTGVPSMDHRGLMIWDGAYWTLGGMNDEQRIIANLARMNLPE